MTIEEMTAKIRAFRDARDWMPFHQPKEMAAAIAIEAAELMEHFLWKTPEECDARIESHQEDVADEIADIALYLFELADNLNINLLEAMERKMVKNAAKYPIAKAKGSHRKYTEFADEDSA